MRPARPSGIAGQTAITFFGNSAGYVATIVTGIVVARTLGPADKGVLSYAMLVMAVLTTFGGGLQSSILFESGRNGKPQAQTYGAALRLLGLAIVPASLVLAAVAFAVPRYASFAYAACAVPFAVYVQITSAVFLLRGDIRSTVVQGAIPTLGAALFTIPALTVFHGGIEAALGVWCAMFGVSAAYSLLRLRAYLPPFTMTRLRAMPAGQPWYALKSGTSSLAGFLNMRVDIFVVGAMLDSRSLGIYSLAVATGELMWQASRPLAWNTMGRIAAADRERALQLTCTVTRTILALEALLAAAVFLAAQPAIHFVYGAPYDQSSVLVRWLVPGMALYAAQMPLAYFLSVKEGMPTAALTIQAVSIVFCVGICVFAIPHLRATGAALATAITYSCAWLATAAVFARVTGVPLRRFTLLQIEDLRRFAGFVQRAPRVRLVTGDV